VNLREYVKAKYGGNNWCLLYCEAKALGIDFPLRSGWMEENQNLLIEGETRNRLIVALVNSKRPSSSAGLVVLGIEPDKAKQERLTRRDERRAIKRTKKAARVAALEAKISKPQPTHEPKRRASLTYDQANSDEFLSSFAWRQLRWQVLKHYGARCMCCGASPEHGAVMNVDHIKSRRRRPDLALDFDNLQVLCGPCNHGKGNDEADFRPAAEPIDPAVAEFIRSIARER
jgi:5-methylcytosine-specific restriction endonuclease McrA